MTPKPIGMTVRTSFPHVYQISEYAAADFHEGIVTAFNCLDPNRRQWLIDKLKAEHLRLSNDEAKKTTIGEAFGELQEAFKRGVGLSVKGKE